MLDSALAPPVMPEPPVHISAFTSQNRHVLKNLYPLYLYDLSQFNDEFPNDHGIFETDPIRTLGEWGERCQNIWFERPGECFGFLIAVDGRPAGFNLVVGKPFAPAGVDFAVQEFFVLNQYRGTGVAARAARDVFDRFRGRWQLHVLPRNTRAMVFWRRTIDEYAGGRFEERADEAPCGAAHIFRFDNSHR